jgi:DNA repair protein RecO (recombination protein O)
MPVYKAEGIVLRRHTIGEADRVITLLTREYGRLRATARGIRRATSRLGGRVEPYTHARFLLARGRTLDVIAQVDVLHAFAGIRADLMRSAHAAYVAELVDRFLPERDRHEDVFGLVRDTLAALERAGEEDAEVVALRFALHLADALGYRPESGACVGCGRSLPRGEGRPGEWWAFSPALGGALCPGCAGRDADAIRAAPGVLAMLGYLLRPPRGGSIRLRIPPAARRDLVRLIQAHLEYRLDGRLRAPGVIERLRESHPPQGARPPVAHPGNQHRRSAGPVTAGWQRDTAG